MCGKLVAIELRSLYKKVTIMIKGKIRYNVRSFNYFEQNELSDYYVEGIYRF